jgi:hypothetical protein
LNKNFKENLTKSKLNILGNWGKFYIFWEALDKWDFMEAI